MAGSSGRTALGANVCGWTAGRPACCARSLWRAVRASRSNRRSAAVRERRVWIRIFQPYPWASRSTNKKLAAPRSTRGGQLESSRRIRLQADVAGTVSVAAGAGSFLHALGDDADLLDTGTLRRVDDVDHIAIGEVPRGHQKHLLV